MSLILILAALVALVSMERAEATRVVTSAKRTDGNVPAQAVLVDPLSFNVVGLNGNFRNATELFNPTGTPPPFFQVFSTEFLDVLGPNATIRLIAQNTTFAFAHEAPVWVLDTDEVFFAANTGPPLGSVFGQNRPVSKINLSDPAIASGGLVNYTTIPISEDAQIVNGGTPFRGKNLLTTFGQGSIPPSLVLLERRPPYNTTVLLDNFYGRQFNALNDLKIHPTSKNVFFTNYPLDYPNSLRPPAELPNQVYRFDPDTGFARVVADGFDKPNGIAFTEDGNTAYVGDSGKTVGSQNVNQTALSTIYAFDVDPETQTFKNRRVFAYIDIGFPDGIQVDTQGRVYSGTGDGVQVWNPSGNLIGKFFLGTTSGNLIFAGEGRLVILAETAIYLANIAATGLPLEEIGD